MAITVLGACWLDARTFSSLACCRSGMLATTASWSQDLVLSFRESLDFVARVSSNQSGCKLKASCLSDCLSG